MEAEQELLKRTQLLLGDASMRKMRTVRVIIFGVGGVGSWCAESLIRSGIRHLTLVDSDVVCTSNINRQLMATTKTVGRVKVDVMKERLLEINPAAEIEVLQQIYSKETSTSFGLNEYDYIIDAIDSLEHKVHLIQTATRTKAVFFSSMGAALKMDASKIKVDEFWKVKGCPLGAALRSRLKKSGELPAKKFCCVFSEERLINRGQEYASAETDTFRKAQINGTLAHTTAIFGFTLAGLVVQDVVKDDN
jgi:tRNA A37 threonylcarbamoyladenosine dehydratase